MSLLPLLPSGTTHWWNPDQIWNCFTFCKNGYSVQIYTNGRGLYGERPFKQDLIHPTSYYHAKYPPCNDSYGGPYYGFQLATERIHTAILFNNYVFSILKTKNIPIELVKYIVSFQELPELYVMTVQTSGFGPN